MTKTPIPMSSMCDAKFRRVEEAFFRHISNGLEIGAGVAVYVHGQKVVDIWGGWRDQDRQHPWTSDTIVCMQSTGKGVGMMCLLMLVDRGMLDLDAPMAKYWPEFAQGGKGEITVRQVMSQGAGLPYLDAAPPGSAFQCDVIIRALEAQQPAWEPGSRHGYHTFTIGFLMDELVRRLTGKPIAQFLRENISETLGVDFFFELTPDENERCAFLYANLSDPFVVMSRASDTPMGRGMRPMPKEENYNSPSFRSWGVPNVGFGNAASLAKIYAALLGNASDLPRFVSREVLRDATREHWRGRDEVMCMDGMRGGLMFMLSNDVVPFTGGVNSFGVPGAGGSIGLADPDTGLCFAFCTNRMVPVGQEAMMRELLAEASAAV